MVGVGFSAWMDSWRYRSAGVFLTAKLHCTRVPFQRIPASAPTGEVSWLEFLTWFPVSSIAFFVAIPHAQFEEAPSGSVQKLTSEKF